MDAPSSGRMLPSERKQISSSTSERNRNADLISPSSRAKNADMATSSRTPDLAMSSFNQKSPSDVSTSSFNLNRSSDTTNLSSFNQNRSLDVTTSSSFLNKSSDVAITSPFQNRSSDMASLQRRISSDMPNTPSFQRNRILSDMANTPSFQIRSSGSDHLDPEVYSAGQSLASILNNPHIGKTGVYGSDSSSWGSWFFSSAADVQDSLPSSVPLRSAPEITRTDFHKYLDTISDSYGRFADVMEHSNWEKIISQEGILKDIDTGEGITHGEGLVACLREIPQLYFKEDFALEDGSTFQAACPYSSIAENMILQEKLSHYLDIIEMHLVREIEARSESFYEAQGQLEDLNSEIIKACEQIQELKAVVQLAEVHVVESAQRIQRLSGQRESLLSLHRKLNLMSYVNQALGDLPSLVASADCGGALDVIDAMQNLLESGELVGFHSFRHLGDRLTLFLESVNSMLAADFVRVTIHDTKDLDASTIIAKFKKRDISCILNAKEDFSIEDNKEKEEADSGLREQLLPLVIGLLRTSKLPAVLRIYRDTLITDIKAAIKVVVAELLSVLISRPIDTETQPNERSNDFESGGISLASKLRGLTAESFVELLAGVFDVIQVRLIRAAEIRRIIEQIIEGLQGSYAEAAVAAAFASGAAAAAAAEAAQADQLQLAFQLQHERSSGTYGASITKGIEAPSPTSISRNFRADVLLENTEAVCSACHAAHERWAKLLGVRAVIHPKLRLREFVSIHSITQVFMLATEKIGGRYASSIRGTLHSQSKAFVDVQHSIRMSKITAVLDQETWVSVDPPDEFQAIVDTFTHEQVVNNGNLGRQETEEIEYSLTSEAPISKISSSETRGSSETMTEIKGLKSIPSEITEKQRSPGDAGKFEGSPGALSGDPTSFQASYQEVDGAVANGVESKTAKSSSTVQTEDMSTTSASTKSKKSRDKLTVKTLEVQGMKFHTVNSGLILLKMVSEYVHISDALPSLASEVVHRVAELLKIFNARTCQLVLGAGAMQVSGLKSVTAKHLSLASQTISLFHTLIPDLKRLLGIHVPDARKALLFTELDLVAQDYKVHRDEIHLKLVQIMKERLMVHLRTFPQIVETWMRSEDNDAQPSQFARAVTKEVGVLHRVLSPLLPEADVKFIFSRVVAVFHSHLSESFSKLDLSSSNIKQRLYHDIQYILTCIRALPSDAVDTSGMQKPGELDEFLRQRYGNVITE